MIFLWGGKTCCTLIATPHVDIANGRQKKGKQPNYKLCVILMQKRIVVFIFANYLDDVLYQNYAMSGLKKGIEMAGMGFAPACIYILNFLKIGLLPENCPREWRLGGRFLRAYAKLLIDAIMIALFACQRLKQTAMREQCRQQQIMAEKPEHF
jgi:hypothetical protein